MDKLFTPNRYFIGFCALLVAVVFAWTYIRDQMLLEEAKLKCEELGTWNWPAIGISSRIGNVEAKILKRTDNDAEVEVQGKQVFDIQPHGIDTQALAGTESNYKATLTLYKNGESRRWRLGKVEGQ